MSINTSWKELVLGKPHALFVEDVDAGMILQCSDCHRNWFSPHQESLPRPCPNCKEILEYPEGASW